MDQIITCYKDMWLNWNNISGRTRRSGYWYAILANWLVVLVLSILAGILWPLNVVANLYEIAALVAGITLAVRRLHDTGHSGWWYLLVLTGIGAIVLLVWFVQDSGPDNKYGPSPKGYHSAPGGYPAGPESYPSYPSYPTYPQGPQTPQEPPRSDNDYNGPELK